MEERLSALGNCITCNDYVALAHPDIDRVCVCGGGMWGVFLLHVPYECIEAVMCSMYRFALYTAKMIM